MIPAATYRVIQYRLVHLAPNTVATVDIPDLLSACMSGIALYACIAIHRKAPAIQAHRCMLGCVVKLAHTRAGMIYSILNIPSTKGMAFALMGLAL